MQDDKKSLKSIISGAMLRTSFISIVLLTLFTFSIILSVALYIKKDITRVFSGYIKDNIMMVSVKEARMISAKLEKIAMLCKLTRIEHERFFKKLNEGEFDQTPPSLYDDYKLHENGVYYKHVNDGGSSLFVSGIKSMNETKKSKAVISERLDPMYEVIKAADDNITAIYFNTYDSVNRYYPFIDNVYNKFMPKIDISEFNFYYLADAEHNPKRTEVWTEAYLDPAHKGWISSCISPVYYGDKLEAVVGIDIRIESIIENLLSEKMPWEAKVFLADKDGVILAMPHYIERLFNLRELSDHHYQDYVKKDTLKPDDFNIQKNERFKAIRDMFNERNSMVREMSINSSKYIVTSVTVKESGWKLFSVMPIEKADELTASIERNVLVIFVVLSATLLILVVVFFIYGYRRSEETVKRIVGPIEKLEKASQQVGRDLTQHGIEKCGINEIDRLSDNFCEMTENLKALYNRMETKVDDGVKKLREKDHVILRQSRQASMGEMIGNIAHQWRQPLNALAMIIQNQRQRLEDGRFDPEHMQEKSLEAMRQIEYMSRTIDDFRNFFRPNKEKEKFSVRDIVWKTLNFTESALKNSGIYVDFQLINDTVILGYKNEYSQALLNVINNARDVLVDRKVEEPFIRISLDSEDGKSVLYIEDNGGGIDEQTIDKIFDPYFTSKELGKGTGLGLYMTKMIIEKSMEGVIEFKNIENGACFIIRV